jgi:tetratricopeptide (TPR) repeat protein
MEKTMEKEWTLQEVVAGLDDHSYKISLVLNQGVAMDDFVRLSNLRKAIQISQKILKSLWKKPTLSDTSKTFLESMDFQLLVDEENGLALSEFMKIGFMGAFSEMPQEAENLFKSLHAIWPDKEDNLLVCLGLSKSLNGDFDNAMKILKDKVLKADPDNDYAKIYIASMYKVAYKEPDRAKRMLKQIISSSDNEDAVKIAKDMI